MEGLLLFVVLVVLAIRWWVIRERLDGLTRERIDPSEITRLIRRITKLEIEVSELRRAGARAAVETPAHNLEPTPTPIAAPKAKPQPAPTPVAAQETKPQPAPTPMIAPETMPAPPPTDAPAPPRNPELPAPLPPPPAPRPLPVAEPVRPSRTGAEWEALVGGNWMNKVGVVVLVVSMALFLGYEFPRLGPLGISTISLALSLVLIGSGVMLERRARYVIFGRGLLAGGWAGLYFTTYAMQALDAARVIHNAALGAVLLLAVAAGMVLHSLRYREQMLTGLAYFMAFVTLAITPVTAFSVSALVPLAGSLLVIAYRFEWTGMALFGMAATYATCASKPDTGAPLWQAQAVFASYWLVFEGYDLLRARRRSNHPAEQAMLPLNALGFGLLSYAKWSKAASDDLYLLTIGVAAAYLASTILRAILRPAASFPAETGTLERILAGGFEGPVTLAAASSALAAVLKLHGQTVNNVLLAEGELLFLAGLFFRQDYPRRLAATLFAALGIKLLATDIPNAGTVALAGLALKDWTPSAAVAALIFYGNRALRKAGVSYGYAGSALAALMMGYETSLRHVGIVWLVFAALVFIIGWRWRLPDFRLQGYLTATLAVGGIAFYQFAILVGAAEPQPHPWVSLACAASIAYIAVVCALRSAPDRLFSSEREQLQFTASAVTSAAGIALLWKEVPGVYLGPAWMALSLALLELGLRRWPPEFRWHASAIGLLGAGRVLLLTVMPFHPITVPADRLAIGSAALLSYLFAARLFAARSDQVPQREFDFASAFGSFFALGELGALLDPVLVAPAWALYGLVLTSLGFQLRLEGLRVQGHITAVAGLGRLLTVNFDAAHRIPAVAAVIAAHYFESWRQRGIGQRLREWERTLDRPYLYSAAGLIAYLLYRELQAPFIGLGWAIVAFALLAIDRAIDLRDLRYQSYVLAALAFVRTLIVEFASPEIFASADERILAGAMVAACLFAAQFIIPPARPSRLYYSLLSTALATTLLFQEVSGSMLTVAWGIEGAVLLGLGFLLRDRTFRLSGLALFLVCVGKLFLYDLRALETLYRILSFFVLGVILVGVSWLYTRFRDQIQRYL